MFFKETFIKGVFLIEPDKIKDKRGFFARVWCKDEFKKRGLSFDLAQCSISFNKKKGTLRGMHYQIYPFEETKLVRVTRGSIFDVALDLREDSPTFLRWFGVVLSSDNRKMLYIPENVAHGFITLEDNTEVFYQISQFYNPKYSRGVRWDDPAFKIKWPIEVKVISEKDKSYPDFRPRSFEEEK